MFCFFGQEAPGILAPPPGTKPAHTGRWNLNHCPSHGLFFLRKERTLTECAQERGDGAEAKLDSIGKIKTRPRVGNEQGRDVPEVWEAMSWPAQPQGPGIPAILCREQRLRNLIVAREGHPGLQHGKLDNCGWLTRELREPAKLRKTAVPRVPFLCTANETPRHPGQKSTVHPLCLRGLWSTPLLLVSQKLASGEMADSSLRQEKCKPAQSIL